MEQGEAVAIIGPNGAGKTTLLLTLAGLLPARHGVVRFQKENITSTRPDERVKTGLVLCPERRRLFPEMTVLENLLAGAYLRRNREEVKKDLAHLGTIFPVINERLGQLAGTLSGGEQQMVAIARALMAKPKLLMLDEPSVGLAPLIRRRLYEKIAQIRNSGETTILLTEQDAELALEFAQRAYVLEHGTLAAQGKASELLADPAIRKSYLGL